MPSALELAKDKLHTSEMPERLLNREYEFGYIRKFIVNGIGKCGQSQSLYISGVPGTGKTASVLKIVDTLKMEYKGCFTFVNINSLELTDPKKLFCIVYKEITNTKKNISPGEAQRKLSHMFSFARKRAVVLLVDELDMLVTAKQEVVYSVFNWASYPEAKINVIAISNTLDLPERTLSHRVSSRMGTNRLCFQPYDHEEIAEIIAYRICNCPAVSKQAVEYAARKIASLSGDLRKALELMRRAIEIALEENEDNGADISKAELTFDHVNEAIRESTYSIRMEMCRAMSDHEEALFRAVVNDLYKSGLEESVFCRVLDEYKTMCFGQGSEPLASSALFRLLMEMASSRIFNLSTDSGEMTRTIQLGFSLPEAQFCIKQMDLKN